MHSIITVLNSPPFFLTIVVYGIIILTIVWLKDFKCLDSKHYALCFYYALCFCVWN